MKVVIVHGCPDDNKDFTYEGHWIPWINRMLKEKGISCLVPQMPTPWKAVYEEWKEIFDKMEINEETIIIGHSCGCSFLVRWLADTRKKIKKLILVAPWKIIYGDYLKMEDKLNFYTFDIDKSIKENIRQTTIFTSNNEELAGRESAKLFSDSLKGKLIELKNHGHFTKGDMGTDEFPELLEEILKL